MGGGGTTSTTNSSQSTDPQVTSTLDQLLKGVSSAYSAGPTYQAPGATTQQGWNSALSAASNPDYASGVNGAISNLSGIASGNALGQQDPGYAALRSQLSNNVLTQTNSAFNNSGLFGSDSNQTAAAQGLTNGLGALDYQQYQDSLARQQQAVSDLPGLYQAAQLPSGTQTAVGSAQDTAKQAGADKNITLLGQLSSILNGSAPAAGSTTTTTSPAPSLLQSLLGLGTSLL
jgi:hypothetical protein